MRKLPDAREVMAFTILALFAFGFIKNPHEPLIVGAMIAAFSTAYGYYLGGSKVGADTATKNADILAGQAGTPAPRDVAEAARATADAADDTASKIEGSAS